MQCAVVEFAQNVLGLSSSSREHNDNTQHPVIDLMAEQKKVEDKGGTMRLGAYPCKIEEGSFAHKAYGETEISSDIDIDMNLIAPTRKSLLKRE